MSKVKEVMQHSPKCRRYDYTIGADLANCPLCRIDVALELIQLRAIAKEAGVTTK